jgi:hypothetical protein
MPKTNLFKEGVLTGIEQGRETGRREARAELKPLIEAVVDTLLMFEDIKKARELPPFANVANQYIAMGNQLRRLLETTGLRAELKL